MFSGIVEGTSKIIEVDPSDHLIQIRVVRPQGFDDLHIGDSISIDGVCLTIEKFSDQWIQFSLAPETLKVTHWGASDLMNREVNIERALAVNSRLHGHWVSGHIDCVAQVSKATMVGESLIVSVQLSEEIKNYIWPKGSVSLNGVSLTINDVSETEFSVCLIPETLKVTNLSQLSSGSSLNLEFDFMARGIVNCFLKGLTPYGALSEVVTSNSKSELPRRV